MKEANEMVERVANEVRSANWTTPKERLWTDDVYELIDDSETPKQVRSVLTRMVALEQEAWKARQRISNKQRKWEDLNKKLSKLGISLGYEFYDTQG